MGRKAYISDVTKATAEEYPGVVSVSKGSEDGELHFCFVPSNGMPVEISLIALGRQMFYFYSSLSSSRGCLAFHLT
jgi:hypothetical protein